MCQTSASGFHLQRKEKGEGGKTPWLFPGETREVEQQCATAADMWV